MSIFQGKLQEYRYIAVDNFTSETLDCQAFFLSHGHADHIVGLDSEEFFERLKTNNMVHFYSSETTKNLMKYDKNLRHLCPYTRDIPVNQSTVIHIKEESGEMKSMVVTLIPAGHCVGSVMFLFEGDQGAVLYTGDFRLQKGDIKRVPCLKSGESVKRIQGLYIDTTFCMPEMTKLPKREETRDAMINLMRSWLQKGSNYAVFIKCRSKYGYEYLLKEIARAFNMKIHLDSFKFDLYSNINDMTEYFTTDKLSTRIHSCRWQTSGSLSSYLPCGISSLNGKPVKVMTIIPSTLWFAKRKYLPDDYINYDKRQDIYRVVHSMHASYEEIRDVVEYVKPMYIYPTVNPVNDDIIGAYDMLKDLLRSKDDGSGETDKKEKTKSKRPCSESIATGQWQLGGQNETVMSPDRAKACFKDLGIRNETASPPMPSFRRKLKKRKQSESDFNEELKKMKDSLLAWNEKDVVISEKFSVHCTSESNDDTCFSNSENNSDKSFEKLVDSLVVQEKMASERQMQNSEGKKFEEKDYVRQNFAELQSENDNVSKNIAGFGKSVEQSECQNNGPQNLARQSIDKQTSELKMTSRQNVITDGQNPELPHNEQPNLDRMDGFQNLSRQIIEEQNPKLKNPSRRSTNRQNLQQQNPGEKKQNIGERKQEQIDNTDQDLEGKSSKRQNMSEENMITVSSSGNLNVINNIDDKNLVVQAENLKKPETFSSNLCHIDNFDIPVSPGYEGPSEEKLHSLYLRLSKEEPLIKN